MNLVSGVELNLDPIVAAFDPAILTHFMAKNWPKKAAIGKTGHKQAWRLQTGGSAWIKVGSSPGTSGTMCWDPFPGPEWPLGGAIGPQNGSKMP